MQNFAALRAAVFPLFMKNPKGGGYPPPPVGARVHVLDLVGSENGSFGKLIPLFVFS